MFTSEELYEVCRRILLESPSTYYTNAHYYEFDTTAGRLRLSNFPDCFLEGFQPNEDQEVQRLALLEARDSFFTINRPEGTGDYMITRPRKLVGFMQQMAIKAMSAVQGVDDMMIFSDHHIGNPAEDPLLQEVYETLKEVLGR